MKDDCLVKILITIILGFLPVVCGCTIVFTGIELWWHDLFLVSVIVLYSGAIGALWNSD